MPRYLCKGSVTAEREYLAGEAIELEEKHAAPLLAIGALEPLPELKKPEPSKSSK